jgi:acyl dehydratase
MAIILAPETSSSRGHPFHWCVLMPLAADCVGLELATGTMLIETRDLLAYAAALGFDSEPRFMDDARPEGLEAVPFICTRFEWQLQRELRRHPALGLTSSETDRGVHFVQDSRFFKPLRPGMNVEARGLVSAVRAVRAGSLIAYDYTLEDTDAGELLSVSRSISIFRDVVVTATDDTHEERRPEQARTMVAPQAPSLEEGVHVSIPITRGFPHVYTECAEIWNPVHTERTAALAAGLPDIILHGTATWALAGRELLIAYCRGGRQLKRLAGRFTGNVFPPAMLMLRHRPDADDAATIHFDVTGANGVVVLAGGLAEFAEAA